MRRVARGLYVAVFTFACVAIGFRTGPAGAQFQSGLYTPTEAERTALSQGRDRLRAAVADLRARSRDTGKPEPDLLPDVEIYLDAVDRNLEQRLFFSKRNFDQATQCLQEGESRAASLRDGKTPWTRQTGVVVLGYRSRIDGSAQPCQVYVPADYNFDAPRPLRMDLFLHGRGGNLNEIAFIRATGWLKGDFGAASLDHLALQPYGRGNNGWRFAGETDVFEALADCKRRYAVDDNQTTLRGFSMGGHGVFHIGLHYPGTWAVISPGAGFVDTKQYLKLREPMPPWQEALLHLYDAVDYASNAKNVPMISYVGELDPKLPQYRLMAEALRTENAPYEEIIAADTEHRYKPESLQSIIEKMAPRRRDPQSEVHYVTYTLRCAKCKWVTIEALEHHWQRAEVDASVSGSLITITTRNVAALRLTPADVETGRIKAVAIDGQTVAIPIKSTAAGIALLKRAGRWQLGSPAGLQKRPGLQGPIDDALYGPMIAVSGTGTAWNAGAERWAGQELQRFRECWGRFFRATLPEATDARISPDDISGKNLYLFGDPGSNAVLRRILSKLPLKWTRTEITIKGKTFSATDHLPLLIFPNPENPARYVVIDTGMTFSRADQEGSNALQYPHLPDYAVIRIDPDHFADDRKKDTELAGFFDEAWR